MEQVRGSDSSSQAVPAPGQQVSSVGAPTVSMKKRKPMPPPRPRSSGGVEATATDYCCHPPSSPQRPPAAAHPHPLNTELLMQDKGPFTLSEFVSKFSRSLPLCVSVEKGYHSDDERHCIANGDKYDVHFVKRSKVAVLKDSTGTKYSIPLSSPIQFSPIFSKDSSDSDSDSEQIFDCVAEVVTLKPLPRLLRATKNYTKDDKLLVEKNEILVVNKVTKKKSLQVYSVLHNREKCLPYDCEGGFTADQYATRLHLPDLISLFLDEFPLRVRVYLTDIELTGGELELDLPYHLLSEASVVTELQTENLLGGLHSLGGGPEEERDSCRH